MLQPTVVSGRVPWHAISPVTRYEPKARELAGLLKQDQVDAVLLTPV